MIKEANKGSNYSHVKELDKLKNKMTNDKYFKQDLFNQLGIPKFNKNEEVKVDIPEDDEEFEEIEEQRRKRAERLAEHNKFSDIINKAMVTGDRQRLKGKAKWAIIAR